ncbi:MAG: iron-containing alcohol dehydrogenase [Hyphomonadaceae bacterium]|nr:MAG: 4-hydroxybutyrate dehydrogenase [Caulobacteraceae bacterium]MBT9444236.1 iron-containing alcohol dehydrogenase [Hyphomonadaceae bacterium]TPW06154.1 MAG: 4-hydroxybutyrate dehydrogenase [Alphaproteobacteria bacterium]
MPVMTFLTTCHFDFGALKQVGPSLKANKVARPFVVTDPGLKAAGLLDRAVEALGVEPAGIYAATPSNPTETAAREAAAQYKAAGADGIVALGGGSSMDMGKAVGLMATHEGPWEKYGGTQRGSKLIGKLPPVIAIPTTAGTGSEVSVGFVLILDNGRKETFVSPNLIPTVAICDPELTLGLPAGLTAATGMDAMTHCIEAILSPVNNPPAEAIGYDGVWRGIGQDMLERAVEDGSDRDARWHVMMSSYEGALAFVKGLGAVHGLSHALGRIKELKLHHGTLNAVILPHSLRMIQSAGAMQEKFVRLRQVMGLRPNGDVADAVMELNAKIGIPASLSAIGVTNDHFGPSAEYAVSDLATASNAIKFGAGEYEKLFAMSL